MSNRTRLAIQSSSKLKRFSYHRASTAVCDILPLAHVTHSFIDPTLGIYCAASQIAPELCSVFLPSYYGHLNLCAYPSQ